MGERRRSGPLPTTAAAEAARHPRLASTSAGGAAGPRLARAPAPPVLARRLLCRSTRGCRCRRCRRRCRHARRCDRARRSRRCRCRPPPCRRCPTLSGPRASCRHSSLGSLAMEVAGAGAAGAVGATATAAEQRQRRRWARRLTAMQSRRHRRRRRLARFGTSVRALRRSRRPQRSARVAHPQCAAPPRRGGVPTSYGGRRRAPARDAAPCLRYDAVSVQFTPLTGVVFSCRGCQVSSVMHTG